MMDYNKSMNLTISRNDAIKLVKTECGYNKHDIANLYISLNALPAFFVKDFIGNKIFNLKDERVCGWFFQYDPTPFANWYHKCQYFFVVNETYFQKIESKQGICDCIKMRLL